MGRSSVPSELRSRSFLTRLRDPDDAPLVIAHRGDSFRAPENTLLAAELAWKTGADAWELDVHLTKDGIPVVLHDESLLRTTNVAELYAGDPREADGYLVSQFGLDEIRTLDAGRWFLRPDGGYRSARSFGSLDRLEAWVRGAIESGAVRIPTLREALEFTCSHEWHVNVELKCDAPAIVDDVAAAVEALQMHDRVLVSSFHHDLLTQLRKRDGGIATGVLTESPIAHPVSYVRSLPADCYHPSANALLAGCTDADAANDPDLIRSGIPVLVYTVNVGPGDVEMLVAFCQRGVSGIFSDDPQSMLECRNRVKAIRKAS